MADLRRFEYTVSDPRRFEHTVSDPRPLWDEDESEMLEMTRSKNAYVSVAALTDSEMSN